MAARSRPKKSPSVIKRARQSIKRQLVNKMVMSRLRTLAKKVEEAITNNKSEEAQKTLIEAIREYSKAASKGVIHKNNSARNISRLTLKVNKLVKAPAA
ncbi:30S ribosomal protein S20 [Candidatus Magnetominusculus dajiuhuensis]|uniref:30S ribosomal protein S20 n=1 Tax=Candidatus Magnetominusculus dajiuhuensis TaxID=3137712 RepID=UPI003B435BC3